MALVKWDPFQDLISVEERINRMFSGSIYPGRSKLHLLSGAWAPVVDISETTDFIIMRAEVPGICAEDITLTIENQKMLILTGVRKEYTDSIEGQVHRIERTYGTFERQFTLPCKVDTHKINAVLEDGVLKVILTKAANREPRLIDIISEE